MIRQRKHTKVKLPTMAVGGSLPSKEDEVEIKKDTEKKIDEFKVSNPEKPKSETKPIESPVEIEEDPFSIDNEYIEIAKRMLGIPKERKPTIVEFAKSSISVIEKLTKQIEELRKPRNDGFGRVLYSSENFGSWN